MGALILVRLILAVSLLPIAGYPWATWLPGHAGDWPRSVRWSLGYLIGWGVVTLIMLSLALLQIKFSVSAVAAPTLLLASLGWIGERFSRGRAAPKAIASQTDAAPWRWPEKSLLAVLIFQIGFSFAEALYLPLHSSDAIRTWGYYGMAFHYRGAISFENMPGVHTYYPLLVPLAIAWVYLALGVVNDGLMKVLFPLLLAAFLRLYYHFSRQLGASRLVALLGTVYLTTAGGMLLRQSTLAMADMPLTVFYGLASLALLAWMRDLNSTHLLAVAGIGAGLTIWTKYEGLAHVVILTGVAGLYLWLNRRRALMTRWPKIALAYGLPILVGYVPWFVFRQLNNLSVDNEHVNLMRPDRLGTILITMGSAMFLDIVRWGVVWLLLVILLIMSWRRLRQPRLLYPSLLIVANLAFYVAAYLVTRHDEIVNQINDTIHRLLLHILPVTVLVITRLILELGPSGFHNDGQQRDHDLNAPSVTPQGT